MIGLPPRRLLVTVLTVAGLTLAGCTTPGPTPQNTTSPPLPPTSLAPSAPTAWNGSPDDLLACLAANNIPASLHDLGDQGKQIIFDPHHYVINRDPTGHVVVSYTTNTAPLDPAEEARSLQPAGSLLIIDGKDYTNAYRACLAQTATTPQPIPAPTRQVTDATTAWAACAQQHGWPDIATLAPTQPGALPEAVIPTTITPQQFSRLLSDCPPLDTTGAQPVFPTITIAASDGTQTDENKRATLQTQLNQAMTKALQQYES